MAKILPFATLEARRDRGAGDRMGEIVIFPGVRIEYHDLPPKPTGSGRPRRGPRRGPPKTALSA
jgi:hypothetical protein